MAVRLWAAYWAAYLLSAPRGGVAVASQQGSGACPVTLLEIGPPQSGQNEASEVLRLEENGLRYISQLASPLYLVPMLGVYRGGKSLLLNRLMGRSAPYAGGFGVGHGQQTFTRGIQVCAEAVEGLGTVVWMDTEGLFSAEDAYSSHGPKIFSLALLFASTVLLNSVKVLNDQFFGFFGEQQQIARVLKQGLVKEGLPQEGLLPGNLSVFWVLQQPIDYSEGGVSGAQLDAFLDVKQDETRARVRRDFVHSMQEVPFASYDVKAWGRLDTLADRDLVPEYVAAGGRLRERIFEALRGARPLQAASAAKQLELYVQLVQTENFSGTLAREAFEQNEIGTLCGNFRIATTELAGTLPSASLQEAFAAANRSLDERRAQLVEEFHLGADWNRRLDVCLREAAAEIDRRNAELVLREWQKQAGQVAEDGSCFFLGKLAEQLTEYGATYGPVFKDVVQARALEYAAALQRARLVECVRLRDLLWPLCPWFAWPLGKFYLRGGAISGLMNFGIHAVAFAGIYVLLQFFGRLPPYLDVDYPVLRMHPMLLNLVLRAPPSVPWHSLARLCGGFGAFYSFCKLLRFVVSLSKPAGAQHIVPQMVNLELKLNVLLKRTEASFKQSLADAALDAASHLERRDARSAALALVRGLGQTREIDGQDLHLVAIADAQLQRQVRGTLANCKLPSRNATVSALLGDSSEDAANMLVAFVARGEWDELCRAMFKLLHKLAPPVSAADAASSPSCASSPSPKRSVAGAEGLEPRSLDSSFGQASSCASDIKSPKSVSGVSATPEASPTKFEGDEDEDIEEDEEGVAAHEDIPRRWPRMLLAAAAVCVTALVAAQWLPAQSVEAQVGAMKLSSGT